MVASSTRRPPRAYRKPAGPKPEPKTLFQQFFKSVGPRTYAAQVKQAANGNHFLVLTEGKRDEKTNELKKNSVFIFSEDFGEFFRLVKQAAEFIKANPVPAEVKAKRDRFWAKPQNRPADRAPNTSTAEKPATRLVAS